MADFCLWDKLATELGGVEGFLEKRKEEYEASERQIEVLLKNLLQKPQLSLPL